jgi:hypothetical protein
MLERSVRSFSIHPANSNYQLMKLNTYENENRIENPCPTSSEEDENQGHMPHANDEMPIRSNALTF